MTHLGPVGQERGIASTSVSEFSRLSHQYHQRGERSSCISGQTELSPLGAVMRMFSLKKPILFLVQASFIVTEELDGTVFSQCCNYGSQVDGVFQS